MECLLLELSTGPESPFSSPKVVMGYLYTYNHPLWQVYVSLRSYGNDRVCEATPILGTCTVCMAVLRAK